MLDSLAGHLLNPSLLNSPFPQPLDFQILRIISERKEAGILLEELIGMLGLLPTQVADLCEHLITHFPIIPDTDVSVNTKVGCAAAGRSRPQACAFVFVLLGSPLRHRIASQTRLYREDYASAELRQAAARRRTSKRDESATVREVTCERGGWDAGVVHCSADGVAPRHLLCHSRSKVLCGPLGGPRASRSRLVSGVVSVTCHLPPPPVPHFIHCPSLL